MSMPALSDATRLPVPRTALVGRRREIDDVSALLVRPDVALVTIVGPGGAGKTRLAMAVANELAPTFRDGAWWVTLSTVHDPALVLPTVAGVLGLLDSGDVAIEHRLHDRLAGAEMLIVLDNLEHLRPAGEDLVALLRACGGVKLLVTSRTVLRLSVEHVYSIAGLPVPPARPAAALDEIERNDAVRLFVARAQAANPMFRLEDHTAPTVLDICRRLEGLPLALELAAARTRILSPQALQADLSQRLALLSGGPADHPRRHHTIRDTVDWSLQLVDPGDLVMFRRLAVFAGPFTAPMAAAVAAGSLDAPESAAPGATDDELLAMYETLTSLIDQSLVHRVSTSADEPRFRLLRTIREVAHEQLVASGEADAIARRHASVLLALAEEAAPHLTGGGQVEWLATLDRSLDDLRAAIDWSREHDAPEMELRFAVALWRFGYTRGHLSEARAWLENALARNPEPTRTRIDALNAAGLMASTQGDSAAAVAAHTEAIALSEALGDRRSIAVALNGLGDAAATIGDREAARQRYEAALAVFRELGDRRGTAAALTNLGNRAWDEQDLDAAVALHAQARTLFAEIDERRGLAWSAKNLGTLAAQQGRLDDARPLLREALSRYEALGDRSGVVDALEGFAEIAHAEGRPEIEGMLFSVAQNIREEIGEPVPASMRERHDAGLERVRRSLGRRFDRIWAEGQVTSPQDAIAMALTLGDGASARLAPVDQAAPAAHGLSPREIEVVRLIAEGRSSKEIAETLFISVRTVGTHITNIFGKLGVSSRSALTAYAHREGLV
jgi:predicted ATPase/DNA-binding CsgD family transcriptional regulator